MKISRKPKEADARLRCKINRVRRGVDGADSSSIPNIRRSAIDKTHNRRLKSIQRLQHSGRDSTSLSESLREKRSQEAEMFRFQSKYTNSYEITTEEGISGGGSEHITICLRRENFYRRGKGCSTADVSHGSVFAPRRAASAIDGVSAR